MGSRDTTESEEMQNAIRKVEDTRGSLKDMYKKMNKHLKTSTGSSVFLFIFLLFDFIILFVLKKKSCT
jgi:hypothetical protein